MRKMQWLPRKYLGNQISNKDLSACGEGKLLASHAMVRAWQSDTASEEDEPVSSVSNVLRSKDSHGDLSDTCSEEDFAPYYLLIPECTN